MNESEVKKITAIESIEEARKESEKWLSCGQMLLDGKNMEQAQEPVSSDECALGLWIYSEEQTYKEEPWFKEIVSLHKSSHEAYSKLYHETLKIYNPKTHGELQAYFIELESHSKALVNQLEKAKDILSHNPESDTSKISVNKNTLEINSDTLIVSQPEESDELDAQVEIEIEADISVPVDTQIELNADADADAQIEELKEELALPVAAKEPENFSIEEESSRLMPMVATEVIETVSETNDFQNQLKAQDLKQLELEKQLLQLDVKQLEERHKLMSQGVEQLKQYQLLKQTENNHLGDESEQLESTVLESIKTKKIELDDALKEQQSKQQELEQMELVSNKLDQKKNEGKAQEEEQLKQLEQKKHFIAVDISHLDEKEQAKLKEIDTLEEQVSLAQQEILKIQEQKQEKSEELQVIENEFSQSKQEHNDIVLKQEKINSQKKEIEASKQKDLQVLDEKQQTLNEELKQLDQELLDIRDSKETSQVSVNQVVKQLEGEQALKIASLKKLEENKKEKQQDLEKLEQTCERIQREMNSGGASEFENQSYSKVDQLEEV